MTNEQTSPQGQREERLPDFDGRGWEPTPGQGADSITAALGEGMEINPDSLPIDDDEPPTVLIGPPWPTIHHHADGGYVWTWCPECGPDVNVDEDGGCVTCGYASVYYGDGNVTTSTSTQEEPVEHCCIVCAEAVTTQRVHICEACAEVVAFPGLQEKSAVVPDGMVLVSKDDLKEILRDTAIRAAKRAAEVSADTILRMATQGGET